MVWSGARVLGDVGAWPAPCSVNGTSTRFVETRRHPVFGISVDAPAAQAGAASSSWSSASGVTPRPVSRWLECHTLRAPGGHLFCVVPVHSDPETFAALARTWP